MTLCQKIIRTASVCVSAENAFPKRLSRMISFWPSSKSGDWKKAVSEAEKIVGYNTSFLSLRCLLTDEISNVAQQMRKLVGTKHPLLKTARRFVVDGKQTMQTRGLLVLLISKAAGLIEDHHDDMQDKVVSGIYQSQRSLAEITEMIYTASLIHKGVVNLDSISNGNGSASDMEFGNKMAVLSGDFLLANASTGLAELNNTKVVEIMSSAIGDMMEAEFTKLRDKDGNSIIPVEGITVEDWENQTYLTEGSLMAKSCKCALLLSNLSAEIQEKAFEFGKYITYAKTAQEEILSFTKPLEENGNNTSVTSLPMISHLQREKKLSEDLKDLKHINSHSLLELVHPDAINHSKEQCTQYGQKALEALNVFPRTKTRDALENMIWAVITL